MSRKKITIGKINLIAISTDNAKAFQIVDIGELRFKLHANTSSSTVSGFNSDLCVKLVKKDGSLENIVDSYSLALPTNGNYAKNPMEREAKIIEVFDGFIKHLKEMYT